jgi:hypothetical protein
MMTLTAKQARLISDKKTDYWNIAMIYFLIHNAARKGLYFITLENITRSIHDKDKIELKSTGFSVGETSTNYSITW